MRSRPDIGHYICARSAYTVLATKAAQKKFAVYKAPINFTAPLDIILICGNNPISYMTLRDVKPFDEAQLALLRKNLKRGATAKQIENLKKAEEHVAKAKANRNF